MSGGILDLKYSGTGANPRFECLSFIYFSGYVPIEAPVIIRQHVCRNNIASGYNNDKDFPINIVAKYQRK